MEANFDVAIIGAGASGVLLAAQLHRTAPSCRIALLDAGARAARGLAYGTPYGAHLLNVPAGKMSAYAQDPGDFVRWLVQVALESSATTFAPRTLYAEYLANVLERASADGGITTIRGSAVGMTRYDEDDEWGVHLHDSRTLRARFVILALGNLPPGDPFGAAFADQRNYVRDPWAPAAAVGLDSNAEILLVGTGLTMVDLVLALRAEGHSGQIHAISRRGLLPKAHAPHQTRIVPLLDGPRDPRTILKWVRAEIAKATAEGDDWRSVIDALRPVTHLIWRDWTLRERRSFLRHLRPYWEVHRHRTAPSVGAQIDEMVAAGALVVHRGRVRAIDDTGDGVRVRFTTGGEPRELTVARVINCTGPQSDYAVIDLPLVVQMRRAGWLAPDPIGLGIETSSEGRVKGSDGALVPGLFAIGPLRRPELWESTAIPEIRMQAQALGELLQAALLKVREWPLRSRTQGS